jgi:hypothetical protein
MVGGGGVEVCLAASLGPSTEGFLRLKVKRDDDMEDAEPSNEGEEPLIGCGLARAHAMLMTPPSPPACNRHQKTELELRFALCRTEPGRM